MSAVADNPLAGPPPFHEDAEPIRTSLGHADMDDYAIRKKMMYRDLRGHTPFWSLIAYGLAQVELSSDDVRLLDELAICCYVSEPRVWPIKIARVVASQGYSASGFAAGLLGMDSELLGGAVTARAASLLVSQRDATALLSSVERAKVIEALVLGNTRVPGLGVPGRKDDERVVAIRQSIAQLGVQERPHISLALKIADAASELKNVGSNIALYIAAICLDVGFRPTHVGPMTGVLMGMSMLANAHEGAEMRSPSLLHLPPSSLDYKGVAPRTSPRLDEALRKAP